MQKLTAGSSLRFLVMIAGSVLWLGIWLTGFGAVHWLLYLPATFLIFAALTGILPGHDFHDFAVPAEKNLTFWSHQ